MLILETLRSKGVQESPIILFVLLIAIMSICLDLVQRPEKGLPVAGKMAKFCKKRCPDGVNFAVIFCFGHLSCHFLSKMALRIALPFVCHIIKPDNQFQMALHYRTIDSS